MIVYQKIIVRSDLRANPKVYYVFGDNMARVGMGGQAREMRGEKNAIGIATKRSPAVYLKDTDAAAWAETVDFQIRFLRSHLTLGGVVVFPADGIGTGLANLSSQAPVSWSHLCAQLETIGVKNGGT